MANQPPRDDGRKVSRRSFVETALAGVGLVSWTGAATMVGVSLGSTEG